jgi:large subunit ribosomal protein L13
VSTDTAKEESKKSDEAKEAGAKSKKSAAKSESTKSEKKSTTVESAWHVIDADGKVLGKLAVQVANLLRGKHKPNFSYHIDSGDHVIIINAEKIKTTGKKDEQKFYRSHSGFPHGFKEETLRSLRGRRPEAVLEKAIKGMIPHNRLGDKQINKLKVYAGPEHPHDAQSPTAYEITKAS